MKKTGVKKKNWWIGLATNDLSDVTGFVLREFQYKETSKIIEVFTKDLGRISIIAKGATGKKSKNLSVTQRFVKASYSLYRSGKDFYGIKEASLIKSYSKSNKSFDIILYKSSIADLLLRTLDQIQIETVYRLVENTFEAFENASSNQINIFLAFLLKYISFSGFKPNLSTCGVCGKKVSGNEVLFSQSQSSLICEQDKYIIKDKTYLNKEEFAYLKALLYTKSEDLEYLILPKNYSKITRLIIDYTLDKLEINRFSSIEWVLKNTNERN